MEIKHNTDEDYVEIRDLGLASALVSVGCQLGGHDRKGGRVYFVFRNNEDLRSAVKDWQEYELDVNARLYFESIKKLKDIIYSERVR